MPIRDEALGVDQEEKKRALRSLALPRDKDGRPVAPEGFTFPEKPEEGLEDEGFVDVIKPYKQAAAKELREEGHPLVASATELLVPDSPLDLLPTGRGEGAMGIKTKLPNLPSGATGANLPEMAEKMAMQRKALSSLREGSLPNPRNKQLMEDAREILTVEHPNRLSREALAPGGVLEHYPNKEVKGLLANGEYDKAAALHQEFGKQVDMNSAKARAAYELQMQKIQKAIGDDAENKVWADSFIREVRP